ncbi:MAG: response regulator [Ruminococcus sp.]|jgi:signal transduction histidine kinase|nr:response regulator [Ruminococcus sp.]
MMNILQFILCAGAAIFILLLLAQFDFEQLKSDKLKRALWITGVAVMGYCLSTGMDAVVADRFFYGFHGFKYMFLILTPFTTLIFSLRLCSSDLPSKAWFSVPLSVITLADIVLFLTNPLHSLMYSYTNEAAFGAPFKWGPLFIPHAAFCYLLSIASVVLFMRFAFAASNKKVKLASLSILLPIGFNVLFTVFSGFFPMDMTAIFYGFVFAVLAFSLYKQSLLGVDIKERERYLDLFLENYPEEGFIFLTDDDYNIRIATKSVSKYDFTKSFDYREAIGKNYYEFIKDHIHEDFAEYTKSQMKAVNAPGNTDNIKDKYDSPLTQRSYSTLTAKYEKSAQIHGGYIIVVNDVTEINRAMLQAEAASVAKSAFLSNISHEIRTPMNAIIGLTSLSLKEDIPAKVRMYLGNIDESGHRLLTLINDVLDISKIESGKMVIADQDFDFANMLSKSINVTAEMAREKNITVEDIRNETLKKLSRQIHSDELRISQIIVNLLSNAVKFTPNGGTITITVNLEEQDGGNALINLSVRDTGIGIAPENINKLFDSFEQADKTITRRFGGTGLGLSISKKIAVLMGGDILVSSQPGKGSEFKAIIPVTYGDEITTQKLLGAEHRPEFDGKQILLVEDVDINRLIAAALLEDYNCFIDEAENGKIAVEMAEKKDYDLILMDMQMPVMDGLTATKEIRKTQKEVPIIAMTANAFREDAERCFEAGMNDHISKPIDADLFIRVLSNYLK